MGTIGINIIENKKIISFDANKGEIKSCTTSDGKVFKAEAFLLSSGAWTSSILEEYRDEFLDLVMKVLRAPLSASARLSSSSLGHASL